MSTMNSTSDGFMTCIESEKFGKMTMESKFVDDGCHLTFSCKGKTIKAFWERRVKVEGSYVFDHGENIDTFFKAVGESEFGHHYEHYKIHFHEEGKVYHMSEYFGDLGRITNRMELDVESPFRVPGEKEGTTPSHKGLLTKSGIGKFTLLCKNKSGIQEEWKLVFSKWGCVISGLEKSTGVTCKFYMRRFWDMVGTYKMVCTSGFEKFAHSVGGLTLLEAEDMCMDYSTKLVITALGHGHFRYQILRKKYPVDISFCMDKEFSYTHPIVREKISVLPSMVDAGTLCLKLSTSKGNLFKKLYFNNEFCIMSCSMPEAHMRYKMIFEKIHHTDIRH